MIAITDLESSSQHPDMAVTCRHKPAQGQIVANKLEQAEMQEK
jgi:hypothetical protein